MTRAGVLCALLLATTSVRTDAGSMMDTLALEADDFEDDVSDHPVDARGRRLDSIDWHEVYAKLPADKDSASLQKRNAIWRRIDVNGNGYCSLAEIDKGLRDVLKLDAVFDCKPAIMRAFQAAKTANGKKSGPSGDYVERNEFRVLLEYMRKYFELYVMFRTIDTDFDRRVDRAEFLRAVPMLAQWGAAVENPDETFDEIDADGGGMILFDEFADWAIWQKLDLDVDKPEGANSGPTTSNLADRMTPDVEPAVSLSLNRASPNCKKRLKKFYYKYMPTKMKTATATCRKYAGKERGLFKAMIKKYGPEP